MVCVLTGVSSSLAQTVPDNFITIIGPDGMPMIVPNHEKKRDVKVVSTPVPPTAQQVAKPSVHQAPTVAPPAKEVEAQSLGVQATPKLNPQVLTPHQSVEANQQHDKPVLQPELQIQQPASQSQIVQVQDSQQKLSVESSDTNQHQSQQTQVNTQQPYREIEGEKYYEAEYLESKEFNLEDKSRFYQIPMSAGGANWDVIERNKGVDMSWFNLRDQQQNIFETIVLGEHYTVLPKQALDEALPNACMSEKQLDKAKDFDKDILALWPRAPFKDEFDYELVSIQDRNVQNFKLSSYAKSDKERTFYWPLVVFLDQKGCVIEGASGYFTKEYSATPLQTELLEGNLQIPAGSQYILFTALAEAIDLPNKELSNQGQVKLTILR